MRNRALSSICFVCILASALSAAASPKSVEEKSPQAPAKKVSSKKQSHSARSKRVSAKSRKGAWKRKGQQKIADDRTREIQAALIKANYLDGTATGSMDTRTKAALARYQQDNGWQTKVVPDSRALIKLGLGPDRSNLLNPTTAALPNIKPDGSSVGSQE